MSNVIRVGKKFDDQIKKLYDIYNEKGKKVKMTKFTDRLMRRMAEEGHLQRWALLARRRKL